MRLPPEETDQVTKLAAFQAKALRHALQFPGARRLAYSTCSVYAMENEEVVAGVLEEAEGLGWRLGRALPSWPRRGKKEYAFAGEVVRVHPLEDETDGFFVALFVRDGEGPRPEEGVAGEEGGEELGEEKKGTESRDEMISHRKATRRDHHSTRGGRKVTSTSRGKGDNKEGDKVAVRMARKERIRAKMRLKKEAKREAKRNGTTRRET